MVKVLAVGTLKEGFLAWVLPVDPGNTNMQRFSVGCLRTRCGDASKPWRNPLNIGSRRKPCPTTAMYSTSTSALDLLAPRMSRQGLELLRGAARVAHRTFTPNKIADRLYAA